MSPIANILFVLLIVSFFFGGRSRIATAPAGARWICYLLYAASFGLWTADFFGFHFLLPTQWFADHVAQRVHNMIFANGGYFR
jgi:hypothetical protein